MKIVLETPDLEPEVSAKKIINIARRRIRRDRRYCTEMISAIQATWGLQRPVAAAVLFAEVRLRTVGDDDSQEFNWPEDADLDEE